MRKLTMVFAAAGMLAYALFAAGACGEIDTCETDSDCVDGRLCHTGEAVNECVVDCTPPDNEGACRDDQVCTELDGSDRQGCLADTGDDVECMDDTDCPNQDVCNDANECETPPAEYTYIQIKDLGADSHAADTCSEDDAGADLYNVTLSDQDGQEIGWGQVITDNLQGDNNTYTDSDIVFDGTPPELASYGDQEAMCPAPDEEGGSKFRSDSVVSLGCDGSIVLAMKGEMDSTVALDESQELTIGEYGSQCCPDGANCPDENVSVTVCGAQSESEITDGEVDENGNFPTCDTQPVVEEATGIFSSNVIPLPEGNNSGE